MNLFKFLVILILIEFSATAGDGISSGGGAGKHDNDGSDLAWWYSLEDKPIKVCIEVGDDSGISKEILGQLLVNSQETWRNYFRARARMFSDNFRGLDHGMEILEECDGKESLTLYFGVENPAIQSAKAEFGSSYAFIKKTKMGHGLDFDAGFIWIEGLGKERRLFSDIQKQDMVAGLILHELGHAWGNEHVDGTIMDKDIGLILNQSIFSSNEGLKLRSRSIDAERELVECLSCRSEYTNLSQNGSSLFDVFYKLMGRMPESSVDVKINLLEGILDFDTLVMDGQGYTYLPSAPMEILLRDKAGEQKFAVKFVSISEPEVRGNNIFKCFDGRSVYMPKASAPRTIGARMISESGEEFPIYIDLNKKQFLKIDILLSKQSDGKTLFKRTNIFTSQPMYGLGDREKQRY